MLLILRLLVTLYFAVGLYGMLRGMTPPMPVYEMLARVLGSVFCLWWVWFYPFTRN